jgi:hypothetical protein
MHCGAANFQTSLWRRLIVNSFWQTTISATLSITGLRSSQMNFRIQAMVSLRATAGLPFHVSSPNDPTLPQLKFLIILYTAALPAGLSPPVTDLVLGLWRCLNQSYTKLNVCSFFTSRHPGTSNSESNNFVESKSFGAFHALCTLATKARRNMCLNLPYVFQHSTTWKLRQDCCLKRSRASWGA